MRQAAWLALAIFFVFPGPASAQVLTTPAPLGPPVDTGRPLEAMSELTQLYQHGRWSDLQRAAVQLLGAAAAAARERPDGAEIAGALDVRKHHVVVVWIADDPFGKKVLERVVVHEPEAPEPFGNDLPGIGAGGGDGDLYEAFLSRGIRGKLASAYQSTREKDAAADEASAFAQAVAGPLFATAGAIAGNVSSRARDRKQPEFRPVLPTVAVTVARVRLPFSRATIKWKAVAKEPVDVDAFWSAADTLARELAFVEVPDSACARSVAHALADTVKQVAAGPACAGPDATTAGCTDRFDEAMRDVPALSLEPACAKLTAAESAAVEKVQRRFRQFVATGMSTTGEAEITFKNRPLTHWTYGAGTAFLATATLTRPRVTVTDDKLVEDPLTRVATMAFVNWSPRGYDAEADRVSGDERVRPFFGVTLTPDFGVTAGGNVLLVRGVGVTVAGVLMFCKGANPAAVGNVPGNADKPYLVSYAYGLLVGVGYNFK